MKILYNNLLEAGALSATNKDPNYPVENVYGNTMRTKFKAGTNSSVITCTLSEASTVSCFAFGQHNIDSVSVQLTDSSASTTTYNYTSSDLVFSSAIPQAMIYEDAVGNIVEIEYTIASTDELYIGYLSSGKTLALPGIDVMPNMGRSSSGEAQKSKGGVTFDNKGVVLENFSCTLSNAQLEDYNLVNAFFMAVQTYKPHFIDRWEDSNEFPVLFAQQTKNFEWIPGEVGVIFNDLSLEWEECK